MENVHSPESCDQPNVGREEEASVSNHHHCNMQENDLNSKECTWVQAKRRKGPKPILYPPPQDQIRVYTNNPLSIFSELTSIRGVQKIRRSQSNFVKLLWVFFVTVMSSALIITTGIFIHDYVQYHTYWVKNKEIDAKDVFPSLTICPQNPFRMEANELWRKKKIKNPKQYRIELNKLVLQFIEMNLTEYASISLLDTTDMYFSNLTPEEIDLLGQSQSMIAFCAVTKDGFVTVGEKCKNLDDLRVVKFMHPKFFNCWTIEATKPEEAKSISDLILLIKMVPQIKIPEAYESFVADMFTRGDGVKVVVHENGTFPDVESDGFSLQPDRINELIFTTIKKVEIKTPVKDCVEEVEPLFHMGRQYIPSIPKCKLWLKHKVIMKECGCVITEVPIPIASNGPMPFCTRLPVTNDTKTIEKFTAALNCTQAILANDFDENDICKRRCTSYSYPLLPGISTWSPYQDNLNRYKALYRSAENISGMSEYLKKDNKQLKKSLEMEKNSSYFNRDKNKKGHYTHIRLYRKSKDTQVETEKRKSSIYVLFSQIGGVCSLTIGLTAACLVEIIESCYLSRKSDKKRNKAKRDDMSRVYHGINSNSTVAYPIIREDTLSPEHQQSKIPLKTEIQTSL